MKTLSIAAALTAGFMCLGCAAHTSLLPVGKGRLAPSVSLGGPFVEAFDTHVPIPYLMAGAEYGGAIPRQRKGRVRASAGAEVASSRAGRPA